MALLILKISVLSGFGSGLTFCFLWYTKRSKFTVTLKCLELLMTSTSVHLFNFFTWTKVLSWLRFVFCFSHHQACHPSIQPFYISANKTFILQSGGVLQHTLLQPWPHPPPECHGRTEFIIQFCHLETQTLEKNQWCSGKTSIFQQNQDQNQK